MSLATRYSISLSYATLKCLTKLWGAMGRSIVIIHVVSLRVANYPHITAFHEDNSNVQMWPDPVEWSGSETIPKIGQHPWVTPSTHTGATDKYVAAVIA